MTNPNPQELNSLLLVKKLIEGDAVNVTQITDPILQDIAQRIAERRNGKTALTVFDSEIAKLPKKQGKAIRVGVLTARPKINDWQDRLNESLDAIPDHRVQAQLRASLIKQLQEQADPNADRFFPPIKLIDSVDTFTKQFPDPVWAVPGIIPIGITGLGGRPKIGKSWLMMQIAQSVATGGIVLGQKVERGRVLYLALEDSERRLQKRQKFQRWEDVSRESIKFILADTFRDQIGYLDAGGTAKLLNHIEKEKYRLVIIDTLSRAFKGDFNDNNEMTRAMSPLQERLNALEIACIIVHHHAKPKGMNPDPVDDLMGGSAIAGVIDNVIGLYKEQGKAGAKLSFRGRDVEEQKLQLSFDKTLYCWQNEGDADEFKVTEERQKILDFLTEQGEAQVKSIAEACDMNKGSAHYRLGEMEKAGKVTKRKSGQNVFYDLADRPQRPQLT